MRKTLALVLLAAGAALAAGGILLAGVLYAARRPAQWMDLKVSGLLPVHLKAWGGSLSES